MTDMLNTKASLGSAIHTISGKWGWFVALGIGELILGGIASADLMAASLASVLVIGASMAAAGIFQIVHAFSVRGLRGSCFGCSPASSMRPPGPSYFTIRFWPL